MRLLENASDDVLTVTSSTLCNLLLEFSPSKEPIVESGAVDLLCNLTRRSDSALRLNGIWALMVISAFAYRTVEIKLFFIFRLDFAEYGVSSGAENQNHDFKYVRHWAYIPVIEWLRSECSYENARFTEKSAVHETSYWLYYEFTRYWNYAGKMSSVK